MSIQEEIRGIFNFTPVGFGFRPTDEELVDHYLRLKIQGKACYENVFRFIPEVDVCKWEPRDVPDVQMDDTECFFLSPLHNKYSHGSRFRRTTKNGYWKSTGKDREIKREATDEVIGTKKTLVFRGQKDPKISWVIHEYRIAPLPANDSHVLCRLKRKTEFPPETKLNGMDMEVDNPSTSAGIHQNGAAHIRSNFGADGSYHASNIASDIRNYLPDHMTPGESHFTRSAVDSGNLLRHCYIGKVLICPQTPLNYAYREGGGSSSDTVTQVAQDGKGSFNFPDTASAGPEPISSPGRCLVNVLVGVLFLVIFIAIMVRDIRGKFSKP